MRGAGFDRAGGRFAALVKKIAAANGLVVGERGKAQFVCAGDTTLGQGPVLAYGDAIEFGGFRCKSVVSGVRCVNRKTQHGFKLSRQAAKVF